MTVGHELSSCTTTVQHAFINIQDRPRLIGHRRIVIVDTPGFDNTNMDDEDTLRRIGVWLASS
jgi:hypothetical protein